MFNIQKLIEEARKKGYQGDKASAKVCQDIVLKSLSIGPLSKNVTIKGGVVMRSKTDNVRRVTQDLDTYIFKDNKMKENTVSDIANRLEKIFNDKGYVSRLDISDKRWIDEKIDVIISEILEFMRTIN